MTDTLPQAGKEEAGRIIALLELRATKCARHGAGEAAAALRAFAQDLRSGVA